MESFRCAGHLVTKSHKKKADIFEIVFRCAALKVKKYYKKKAFFRVERHGTLEPLTFLIVAIAMKPSVFLDVLHFFKIYHAIFQATHQVLLIELVELNFAIDREIER